MRSTQGSSRRAAAGKGGMFAGSTAGSIPANTAGCSHRCHLVGIRSFVRDDVVVVIGIVAGARLGIFAAKARAAEREQVDHGQHHRYRGERDHHGARCWKHRGPVHGRLSHGADGHCCHGDKLRDESRARGNDLVHRRGAELQRLRGGGNPAG